VRVSEEQSASVNKWSSRALALYVGYVVPTTHTTTVAYYRIQNNTCFQNFVVVDAAGGAGRIVRVGVNVGAVSASKPLTHQTSAIAADRIP
jgi:hypothetical protein